MITEIRNELGERLEFDLHPAPGSGLLLIGHGVTGNMDRPWAVALAERAAAAGFSALRFSFSGNGGSEGRFEDATISKEVDDLGSVLNAVSAAGLSPLAYAGHSMGGAVGVIRAARDPRIATLISLAGMVETKRFVTEEFGEVEPGTGCMWEQPSCPLSQAFVDDLVQIDSTLPLASQIRVPWLLVHGDEDDVVPPAESLALFRCASEPRRHIELPGSNHVFSSESATAAMTAAVIDFLKQHHRP